MIAVLLGSLLTCTIYLIQLHSFVLSFYSSDNYLLSISFTRSDYIWILLLKFPILLRLLKNRKYYSEKNEQKTSDDALGVRLQEWKLSEEQGNGTKEKTTRMNKLNANGIGK